MQLHRSNRAEALVDALARVVAAPRSDPLAEECVVVQGQGIERWLSLELATRLGLFANASFPFPRAFLQRALEAVGEAEASSPDPWEPEALAWAIADALPARLADEGFQPIRTYLDAEAADDKLIALAVRIAETFDHYAVYRPEMVLAWERGDDAATRRWTGLDDAWQPVLWRELVARLGDGHWAGRVERLVAALLAGAPVGPGLPDRACLFGLSTLPPLFVSALSALSPHVELHAFVLSPSREYWGSIRSEREALRLRARTRATAGLVDEEDLHIDEGHPLLASLGRVGRDFQEILEACTDYHESDLDLHADPALGSAPSLLQSLQSDILALRGRGGPDGPAPALTLAPDDDSISIHSCHGPMREAEVLRDQLLELFARDPSLEPHEVVVMAPDASLYAPFVQAAFAPQGEVELTIPTSVADRGARAAFPVVEAFGRLLDVLDGRLAASDVLELLGLDCIRARFGITLDDEALLRAWIDASGIRWGIDAGHRAREGQPEAIENTWRFGLDRLFVGMAIEDGAGRMFGGVVPQPGVEGSAADALGRLSELLEALFDLHARARTVRSVAEWARLFTRVLDRMIVVDGSRVHERQAVLDAIDVLEQAADGAGHSGPVSYAAARDAILRRLDRTATTGGFVTGAVTLCEMLPMRSVPFRVVALMGLDDQAFPRSRPRPGFDLIGARRRPGDRSARDDDRQLFLEALLSAREHLLITYVGRDIRDNEPKPPSVVVDELLDHVARVARPDAGDAEAVGLHGRDAAGWARARLVVPHPLQPWSPQYFADPDPGARLFSYSPARAEAARELGRAGGPPTPFVAAPLTDGETDRGELVSLETLQRYFAHPARFLVGEVLALRLDAAEATGPEREPLDVEGLAAFTLGSELLELALSGGDVARTRRRFAGQGLLPLGEAGRAAHAEIAAEATALAKRVESARSGRETPSEEIELDCGGVRVTGRLDRLFPGGRVAERFARTGRGSELEVWIAHVALCAARPSGVPPISHFIGRGEKGQPEHVVFDDVAEPQRVLADLIEIHRVGRTRPLPLFPRASRRFAEKLAGQPGDATRLEQARFDARAVYGESQPGTAESLDPYIRQLFADLDPLAPGHRPVGLDDDPAFGFEALAQRVFAPLLAHRKTGA